MSKNTPGPLANIISQTFNILHNDDLGLYLGVTKILSKAAWYTLIKSVMSIVPFYFMQTLKLLVGIISELDKINRRFFWGADDTHKKNHAIVWSEICKVKEAGVWA